MSEMSVVEAYRVLQAECGIEEGDTVGVLRRPRDGDELGWNYDGYGAVEERKKEVGNTLEVTEIDHNGFLLGKGFAVSSYPWPFFVLELVEKASKLPDNVTFTPDGLKVGEVFLSKDTIRRNLDL